MNFKKKIQSAKVYQKRYAFYCHLGYSCRTAEVLSTVTYGESDLSEFIRRFRGENAIVRLHAWLSERQEEDPWQAIRNALQEERPVIREDPDMLFSFAEPPENMVMYKAEEEPEEAERIAVPTAAPAPVRNGGFRFKENLADGSAETVAYKKTVPHERKFLLDIGRAVSGKRKLKEELGGGMPLRAPSRSKKEVEELCDFMEDLATDSYEQIEEKGKQNVFTAPTSTFRMTTNTASMGVVMNQLRSGRDVDLSQVRIEEILNYFDYDAALPQEEKFSIETEILPKGENKELLCIHVQGREERREHQNIVLLLDTSGSMSGNSEATQEAVAAIVSTLRAGDTLSFVTYSTKDETVLDGFRIRNEEDRENIMAALLGIEISGCTWGSAGIETAYRLGAKHYRDDANNQVILITDGDLNFGITEKSGLQNLIEEKKKSNLFLSVIGTGLLNYKDDKLETLSKHGNGTYCVVNCLEDVEESIEKRYSSLTNIIAKDVKAQVEFNPRFVKSYRLLGYENRQLSHEDFANDAVISEPYGSGGHGVALYELEMNRGGRPVPSGLKYQTPVLTESEELCTVKVRYKEPLADTSREIEKTVLPEETDTRNVKLAYLLYCISEKLRRSDRLDEYDRKFLDVMLTSRLYGDALERNGEKLRLFLHAVRE